MSQDIGMARTHNWWVELTRFRGHVDAAVCGSGRGGESVSCFERRGGDLAEGRVPPARVVERLEVAEDGELRRASGGEASAGLLVEELALQRGEHALGQRVVEAVGDAAHAG